MLGTPEADDGGVFSSKGSDLFKGAKQVLQKRQHGMVPHLAWVQVLLHSYQLYDFGQAACSLCASENRNGTYLEGMSAGFHEFTCINEELSTVAGS